MSEITFLPELFGYLHLNHTRIRSTGRARGRTAAGVVACLLNAAAAGQSLAPLGVNPTSVTVSGVSSGGFMAIQFAVAHAAIVQGVGVIAAGPYACAQFYPLRTSDACLRGHPDERASKSAQSRR